MNLSQKLWKINLIQRFLKPIVINRRFRHSYVFGQSNESLVPNLVSDILERNAIECPESIACISKQQNIIKSYREMNKDVNQLSRVLMELGCEKGTRVGLWSHNCYEWIVTQFATAKLGCILVNVNPSYKVNELKYCLDLVGCHTLISSQRFKTSNYYELLQTLMPSLSSLDSTKNIKTKEINSLRNIVMISHPEEPAPKNFLRFNDLMNKVSDEDIQIDGVHFDDAGTTGRPKGATLSHHNLYNNTKLVSNKFLEGMENQTPIVCCQVPLYHAFGCVAGTLVTAFTKGTLVFPSEAFNPKASLVAIEEFKCNYIYGTPTMFVDLLNAPNNAITNYNTTSVLRGVMGGTTCPPELMRSLHKSIPTLKHISIVYGSTELSPGATTTSIYDSEQKRFETVGKALDHTEIKIVDHKTGKLMPIGEAGEILVRGYCTFIGYWNQRDKTQEAMNDMRWYKTGDIGFIDSEGYLSICSRIKEMIIRGGENIYPREIEELLLAYPLIADVQIVGVSDSRMGEEMCAFIRLKSDKEVVTEEDIKTYFKDKISHFKIPRYIEFVKEYPRTVTGKVQKFILKEIANEKYGN